MVQRIGSGRVPPLPLSGGGGDVTFAVFAQMGSRTAGEYLEEIRPVRETKPDGSRRLMLRVAYGSPSGAKVLYFHDPAEAQPELRGFGWTRMEAYAKDQGEIIFSFPDGRTVPESAPKDD